LGQFSADVFFSQPVLVQNTLKKWGVASWGHNLQKTKKCLKHSESSLKPSLSSHHCPSFIQLIYLCLILQCFGMLASKHY
jgi:hypothetical protein